MENATEAVAVETKPEAEVKAKKQTPKPKAKKAKAQVKTAKKAKASKKAKRLTEQELKKRYPHFIEGTLHFDEKEQRNRCKIRCSEKGCKKTREVATSDLFQVKRCVGCTKAHRNEQRKKK